MSKKIKVLTKGAEKSQKSVNEKIYDNITFDDVSNLNIAEVSTSKKTIVSRAVTAFETDYEEFRNELESNLKSQFKATQNYTLPGEIVRELHIYRLRFDETKVDIKEEENENSKKDERINYIDLEDKSYLDNKFKAIVPVLNEIVNKPYPNSTGYLTNLLRVTNGLLKKIKQLESAKDAKESNRFNFNLLNKESNDSCYAIACEVTKKLGIDFDKITVVITNVNNKIPLYLLDSTDIGLRHFFFALTPEFHKKIMIYRAEMRNKKKESANKRKNKERSSKKNKKNSSEQTLKSSDEDAKTLNENDV